MLITFYAIVGGDERYIGSTKKTLERREYLHKWDFKQGNHTTNSHLLYEKYGVENCRIEEIETRECATLEERYAREGELIRATPNCVNTKIMGKTRAEYYQEHREEILSRHQERRDELLEYNKTYHEANKERIHARQKAYYEANRDKILALQKENRERRRAAQTN